MSHNSTPLHSILIPEMEKQQDEGSDLEKKEEKEHEGNDETEGAEASELVERKADDETAGPVERKPPASAKSSANDDELIETVIREALLQDEDDEIQKKMAVSGYASSDDKNCGSIDKMPSAVPDPTAVTAIATTTSQSNVVSTLGTPAICSSQVFILLFTHLVSSSVIDP